MNDTKSILAVGAEIDFTALDDPAQTISVLMASIEKILGDLRSLDFSDRKKAVTQDFPALRDRLKDLVVAIDFLEMPKSKGVLPEDSEFFQIETGACYRALELFLSYGPEELSFSEWQPVIRAITSLEVNYRSFYKVHTVTT